MKKILNHYIDHTLLKADASSNDIIKLCKEAKKYHFNLLTPMIWEIIDLDAKEYHFKKWREEVENNFHLFHKKEW